ncbi:MAG: hypothetical protein ACRD3S_15870 [Terracidiphilus sp.]
MAIMKNPMMVAVVTAALAISTAAAQAPCVIAAKYGISCNPPDVTSVTAPTGPQTYVLAAWKLGDYGTTPATVAANFAYVQYENFANNTQADAMVTGMTNDMIARLSTAMYGSSYLTLMLDAAAKRLSVTNLRRFQGAFGLTPMQAAVLASASTAVCDAYKISPKSAAIPGSQWFHQMAKGGVGTPWPVYSGQWLYELFLDHYTGTLESVQTALHQSMIYGQVRIKAGPLEILGAVAGALGIIQFFDPNAWQDFKGWVAEQYNNLQEAIPSAPFIIVTPFPQGGGVPDDTPNPDPEVSPTELTPPGASDVGVACHKQTDDQC